MTVHWFKQYAPGVSMAPSGEIAFCGHLIDYVSSDGRHSTTRDEELVTCTRCKGVR